MQDSECEACVKIIKDGGAVDHHSAARELRRAAVVAIARNRDEIVGVGVIKRARPWYAARIAERSGVSFQTDMKELGYVAVDSEHRRRGLSSCIVSALLSTHDGQLFATTDDAHMKRTLEKAGLLMKGKEWYGKRSQLSLWMRG